MSSNIIKKIIKRYNLRLTLDCMTYAAEGMGSLTQTGQRSGRLTINSDQQRSGRAFALGLRKWWIPPPLKAPNHCLRETSHALCCCFFKRFSKRSSYPSRGLAACQMDDCAWLIARGNKQPL